MNTIIDISQHESALCDLADRHQIPVSEVIDRIIAHGIEREYEVFDWSPSSQPEVPRVPEETIVPSAERESA